MSSNEIERQRWNDEWWATAWPKRERFTSEVTPHLLSVAALQAGERVLDVGSGGGLAALGAADVVGPSGAVTGADISRPLSRLAQSRAAEAGASNVAFVVADAQHDRIPGSPFDVAISQFGVMFFDEPATAFANIRAHLRPGGRVAFACWQAMDRNPWFFAPALVGFLRPPPPPAPDKSPTGPFALADGDRVRRLFEVAGYSSVALLERTIEIEAPEDALVDREQLTFMGVAPDRLDEAAASVANYLGQFRAATGVIGCPLAFQIVTATSP